MARGEKHRRACSLRLFGAGIALVVLLVTTGGGTALAANRWTDITDQQWVDVYQVTAAQVATVAAGYSDGTFRPGLAVNRGQVAKMVVTGLSLGTASSAAATFTDVPATNYYFPWVEGAVAAKIVSGYSDGTFRPATPVSRQQANAILGSYLAGVELKVTGQIQGQLGVYPSLSAWYQAEGAEMLDAFIDQGAVLAAEAPGTAYLVYHHVVEGSSNGGNTYLKPGASLTRAQAVTLILRVGAAQPTPSAPTITLISPAAGLAAGGNQVVITGSRFVNLTGHAAVQFGAADATSYTVNSPTQITAVAPAGTGTVDVTVTTPAGTSATGTADEFTYAPTVSLVDPGNGPAAGGTAVTITGTGFTGATAADFGSTPAAGVIVVNDTQITAVAPAGTAQWT